jgi:hypothetical protein
MDGPILGPTHGIVACSGGQARFVTTAKEDGLQVFIEGGKGYYRSDNRSMPHNLYLRPADIWSQADPSHQALPAAEFQFAASDAAATAVLQGEDVGEIAVTISAAARPKWAWDDYRLAFVRSERDTPANAASGVRLMADNVIALSVEIRNEGGSDAAGSPIPETMIVGSGTGIVASGGKVVEVTWSKKDATSPVELKTVSGDTVRLVVGQTWIELVPSSNGSWELGARAPGTDEPKAD